VYDVAASVAAGSSLDRILAAYPSLDAEKVRLAEIYAEANPPGVARARLPSYRNDLSAWRTAGYRARGRRDEVPD